MVPNLAHDHVGVRLHIIGVPSWRGMLWALDVACAIGAALHICRLGSANAVLSIRLFRALLLRALVLLLWRLWVRQRYPRHERRLHGKYDHSGLWQHSTLYGRRKPVVRLACIACLTSKRAHTQQRPVT